MCLLEQFPWWKFPILVAVQTAGAFVSAGAVYALYYGTGSGAGAWQGSAVAGLGGGDQALPLLHRRHPSLQQRHPRYLWPPGNCLYFCHLPC